MAASGLSLKRFGHHCSVLGHGLAIVCAVFGVVLIVAAPLESVVYGIALVGAAIALDVIVAVHCSNNSNYRRVSNLRSRAAGARKR